jgi:hypothetical protein
VHSHPTPTISASLLSSYPLWVGSPYSLAACLTVRIRDSTQHFQLFGGRMTVCDAGAAVPPHGSPAFAEDDDARSQQVGVGGGAALTDGWGRAVGKSVGILGR